SPRRAMGQNFVVDPNTVRRVARLARVGAGGHVVEIGAGLGSLTLALAETGASVTAVELDRTLARVLDDLVADLDVTVVCGDALELDWSKVVPAPPPWALVANLPYNVATQMVLGLLRDVPAIDPMLVMVQREVGERLAARPGDPAMGIPSVIVAYHGTARVVGTVPASVFHPRPRVESVLVRIERHTTPAVDVPLALIDPLVRAAFGQRRKMIRRSLAGLRTSEQISEAGIDPTARPDTVTLGQWASLARS
ncbi:MAG: 16S rRNA (adenine(1518)-N(6)/adenine(1519)-N(6))-dimethyltransferase RsmA, partial [Acidimicrobiales bacterium]